VPVPLDRSTARAVMPRPLLSQRAEERLGPRHREVLDALERHFLDEGFAGISVRELAASVGCSRRTLYEIAPSKDELVLVVLDRFLHRVGRTALDAIGEQATFAERIRAYFLGGVELQRLSQAFADDLADEPAARRLFDRHFRYVMAVTEDLVVAGIKGGEFRQVSPAVVAGVLAGSGLYFNQVEIAAGDPVGEMLDLVIDAISRS
jgi:AcrR family transcriptional regulator